MSLFGSQYGGPDFHEESPASQRLTIDEYFYTDTAATIELVNGVPQELPFNRSSISRCSHVELELLNNDSSVHLRQVCGIGSYRAPDGMGLITGMSVAADGSFVYDG